LKLFIQSKYKRNKIGSDHASAKYKNKGVGGGEEEKEEL